MVGTEQVVTLDVITSLTSDAQTFVAYFDLANGVREMGTGSTEDEAIADLKHEVARRRAVEAKRPAGYPKTVTLEL